MAFTTLEACIAERTGLYGAAASGVLDHYEHCEIARDVAQISVGMGGVPVFEPWYGVPQMVPVFTGTKEDLLHESPTKPIPPHAQEGVPMTPSIIADPNHEGRYKIVNSGYPDEQMGGMTYEFAVKVFEELFGAPEPIVYNPPENTTMDLGSIGASIVDIGLDALRARAMPTVRPVSYAPAAAGAIGRATIGAAGGAATALGVAELMEPRKKRRRRRRLATVSDIKDLAALKAVLGNGEAFKTWIATHSR